MQPSFYLGIHQLWDELLIMQTPGLYWLNVDRQEDALAICRQTINHQTASASVALIAIGSDPNQLITQEQLSGINELRLFSLPASRPAIAHLSDDLMRGWQPRDALLIVYAPAELWKTIVVSELFQWLKQMSGWLSRQNNTLLVVNDGLAGHSVRSHLIAQHRSLSGLANLGRNDSDNVKYEVDFWCNERGVFARQRLNIISDERGLSADNQSSEAPSQFTSDKDVILAVKNILGNESAPSEAWKLFERNDDLLIAGQHVHESTLVFSLERRDQVESLAYMVYHLRQQQGNGLKIIVKAMTPSLRASDEFVLRSSGANLVINFAVPFVRFTEMLTSIQGEVFSHYLPEDISALIKAIKPLPLRGAVDNSTFSHAVIDLMNNALLPQDNKGLLVSFVPTTGLTAKQALTLCKVRRDGDLVTLYKNRLILFLFSCKVSELSATLRFLFKLPSDQIFRDHTVWYKDSEILENAYLLQTQPDTEQQSVLASDASDELQQVEVQKQPELSVNIPEAITLVTPSYRTSLS